MDKLHKIFIGNFEKYNALASYDENSLYIIEDESTKVKYIFKGDKKIAGDFIINIGNCPDEPEEGVIYYISEFSTDKEGKNIPFTGFFYDGEWISVCRDLTEELDKKQNVLTEGYGISISDENVISSTLDISLYKIVSALPTTDIDDSKIYLVINTTSAEDNKYKEYLHHEGGWELLGEYKAEIPINEYLKIEDAEKTYMKLSNGAATISVSTTGSMNNFGDNGQAFNAVRDCGTNSITGYKINAGSFGVKKDGTTAFSHKKYDTFDEATGKYTGAKNTAVLIFSGQTGLMYAKNTGSAADVTDAMYRYVGVIDSPDEAQRVYSKAQVDTLISKMKTILQRLGATSEELASITI